MEILKTNEDLSKQVGVRLEPKMRYLAELAAEVKGFDTLSDYIKWAIEESFQKVSLHRSEAIYDDQRNPIERDPETERAQNEVMSLSNRASDLWSESVFERLESLSLLAPSRLSDEDKAFLNYIHNRKDLKIEVEETHKLYVGKGYKLNRAKIDSEWETIKAAFAKASKGKVK